MSHKEAVDTLKNLPKGKRWSTRQALAAVRQLDKNSFTKLSDYAEAVTAAIIGQRWQSVSGQPSYDTASTLSRWLGAAAKEYGDPEILFDCKTQKQGVGYSDKITERANKASEVIEKRNSGKGVINGVVFHTQRGVFFQLGIDHEGTTPQFGKDKRQIVRPQDLSSFIDGQGGILPAILLTSKITWDGAGFQNIGLAGVREINRTLSKILKTVLGEAGMEKVQKHLDIQAKKAVRQATRRMANATPEDVGEEIATNRKVMVAALAKLGYSEEEAEDIIDAKSKKDAS